MLRKYDLVVIGSNEKAILTAQKAVQYKAKVALIFNPDYYSSIFEKLESIDLLTSILKFKNYSDFIEEKKRLLFHKYLPESELLGIDIIFTDECHFRQEDKLYLMVKEDKIKSHSYLLLMSKNELFVNSDLENNQDNQIITIQELLFNHNLNNIPSEITIVGNNIDTLLFVNKLSQLEKKISLILPYQQLLPSEDSDISYQIQLFLESQGVTIYYQDDFPSLDAYFDINTLRHTIINSGSDEIKALRVTIKEVNYTDDRLGLRELGINQYKGRIIVNEKMQTKHPQIYVCGDLLGGYGLDFLTENEIEIGIKNALFFPYQRINYREIPYQLPINPPLNRIGYTEKQARLSYGNNLHVINIFPSLDSTFDPQQQTFFVKIILDNHNQILGFHSLGVELEEIFAIIVFLKKNKLPLEHLFNLKLIKKTSLYLINKIKQILNNKNSKYNHYVLELLETFFIWKSF